MNNKGQTILNEYMMIFLVVVAAIVAMNTFVQRGLQARIHDARNYMINAVVNNEVCDANCMQAAGGNIAYEYEPYYERVISDVYLGSTEKKGTTPGNAGVLGVIDLHSINQVIGAVSNSVQRPAACANDTTGSCL